MSVMPIGSTNGTRRAPRASTVANNNARTYEEGETG